MCTKLLSGVKNVLNLHNKTLTKLFPLSVSAGLRTNKPLFAIRKSFRVENAGELPLTVMSMNINGYGCQGFGFEVLQCQPFSLDHNSSSEITIA